MTEAEWLACRDPELMLGYVQGKSRPRKFCLLACACCRHVWHLLTDPRFRSAVEIAEQFADSPLPSDTLASASVAAFDALREYEASDAYQSSDARRNGVIGYLGGVYRAAAYAADAGDRGGVELAAFYGIDATPERAVDLIRDIFGNPFAPPSAEPSWLNWKWGTVPAIARHIHDGRRFEDLPILADALEEAGCADAAILGHCRGPGPHVRGCWVLDVLLGKT